MFDSLIQFIRTKYQTHEFIPLNAPTFNGKERKYLQDVFDSTYVSSVGAYVDKFEDKITDYTKAQASVVTNCGTSALHTALLITGVQREEYVITQSLSFVATCNAIAYCGAKPIFIDVDKKNMGLSPDALSIWLEENAFMGDNGISRYKKDDKVIRACLPMHTFGHPVALDELLNICKKWNLVLIEDAAEALGSFYKGKHAGTIGEVGTLSFNGNKIITSGAGGAILTNKALGQRAKHLTTTAKVQHPFEYYHDEIGYNYRLPNINAALGCAQLEQLDSFIMEKRKLALSYQEFFKSSDFIFVTEPDNCRSNYWLNAVICEDLKTRDNLLVTTNKALVMTRPLWQPLHTLPMFNNTPRDGLNNTLWLADRVVNLPSSVINEVMRA